MTDKTEKAMVRLSDGTWAEDLIEERPLVVFDADFTEKETFAGNKAGLRAAAAEIIRRRTQKGN
jgi:hypothetical protein